MKRWLILAFLLITASAYASSVVFSGLNDPLFCANCHTDDYKNYTLPPINSDLPAHKEKNITCIECHSSHGAQSELAAKKFLINILLTNYSLSAINILYNSNFTFNQSVNISGFAILKASCIKCHNTKKISSLRFNHSNTSYCGGCHIMHNENKTLEKPDSSFWRRMGEGGHRNRTCGDCHGTDPRLLEELPQCTKCHIPHLKGTQWDRSICLGCHNDPHLPVKKAVFSGTITKEMCAACHDAVYRTLTTYNSKHNNQPSCTSCHPKHGEAITCMECHSPHGPLHKGSECSSCHSYVDGCPNCHTNPHAPLNGLPRISDAAQFENYAKLVGNRTKS